MATKTQQPKPAGIPKWGILLGVVAALWAVCSYLDSIVVSETGRSWPTGIVR
jgi:hypothetical protein